MQLAGPASPLLMGDRRPGSSRTRFIAGVGCQVVAYRLHKLLPELTGCLVLYFLELLAEMRPALVAAFITDLQDGLVRTGEQFTGMADAQVTDEIEIGLLDVLFKEATESGDGHIGNGGDLVEGDGFEEMLERIIDDLFDGGVYGYRRIVEVFRQHFVLAGGTDGMQAAKKVEQFVKPLCLVQRLHSR